MIAWINLVLAVACLVVTIMNTIRAKQDDEDIGGWTTAVFGWLFALLSSIIIVLE